ncbi:SDR family NAD(P)-dependent oxidoreductase [Pseudonocardia ailaonensis]|uniref:SDR family NAD(P)-dependent oxidoreductase n=1 Tax=Pseudonocardia ailaonensis TaxID=367279 RepID=A0ABN2N9D4_9PSEU
MPEELTFDDQVAVVTGAGRGLGRAHALLLAERGAAVVVNDVQDPEPVVREIIRAGGRAAASTHDIADEGQAHRLIDHAVDTFGRLDALVNNAGVIHIAPFEQQTRAHLDRMMGVHVLGTWALTQAAWRVFREQRYGRIVVTTSAAGLFGMKHPPQAAYSAAKSALVGLTLSLAAEAEAHDVKVNALAPRAFTPLQAQHMTDAGQAERLAVAQPADAVSPVVAALAHRSCPVNGQVLFACGGQVQRAFTGLTAGITTGSVLTPEEVVDRIGEIVDTSEFTVPEPYVAPRGMQ